jgi:hypothetical protein
MLTNQHYHWKLSLLLDTTSSHYQDKRSFFTQTQYRLNTMQYLANDYNQTVLMPVGWQFPDCTRTEILDKMLAATKYYVLNWSYALPTCEPEQKIFEKRVQEQSFLLAIQKIVCYIQIQLFPLWQFVFLDVGPSILFLVFPLFGCFG